MTKEFLSSVPEFFYDLLGLFLPGLLTITIIVISPAFAHSELAQNAKSLPTIERILFILSCGYIIGQVLTVLSDLLIRQPVWLLFGEPAETLLGGRDALVRPIPRAFQKSFLDPLKTEIEAVAPGSLASRRKHSPFDICEQYIKQKDQALGMLCQKRHAVLVMCRNMVVALFLALPLYWSVGYLARSVIIVSAVCLFSRWNYLRTRRAEFLYHSFHLTFIGGVPRGASAAAAHSVSKEVVANDE